MALDGTFAGLKASLSSWLHRSDLTDTIADLVVLAESRLSRDLRLQAQIDFATLACVADQNYVELPADYLEAKSITLVDDTGSPLTYQSPEQLGARFPVGGPSGRPTVYTVAGDRLFLGPTPDSTYSISLTYFAQFAALSDDEDTNWLLTKHPSLYLFAALAEAAPFMEEDPRAALWEAKYGRDKDALQLADDKAATSGSALRVRTIN